MTEHKAAESHSTTHRDPTLHPTEDELQQEYREDARLYGLAQQLSGGDPPINRRLNPQTVLQLSRTIGNRRLTDLIQAQRERPSVSPLPRITRATIQRDLNDGDSDGDEISDEPLPQTDQVTANIQVHIVGHASPRWEHTQGSERGELNLNLSGDRAAAVERMVRDLITGEGGVGPAPRVRIESECRDHDQEAEAPTSVPSPAISSTAVGHSVTEREAGGDTTADQLEMRRVNVRLGIEYQYAGEAPVDVERTRRECEQDETDQWGIQLAVSGGAGHEGAGVAFFVASLKNMRTNRSLTGAFGGGGAGVGLSTPGADPGWSDYSPFTTNRLCTFHDFHGSETTFASASGGIVIISGSLAIVEFPDLGTGWINVSGFSMGGLGGDASVNTGRFWITDPIPGPRCRTETVTEQEMQPYGFGAAESNQHIVTFETGQSEISADQQAALEQFIQGEMAEVHHQTTPRGD